MKHLKPKNFFILFLSVAVFLSIGSSMVARADRDDDEEDDNRDEERIERIIPTVQQPVAPVEAPAPKPVEAKVEKPKTATKAVAVPPITILVDEIKDVEFPDIDRDGLIDNEDAHPNIPEIYFVNDNNQNGIVDIFE